MADKAVAYINSHPVQHKSDEKRLYYVFEAWNIYPFVIRWQVFKDKKAKEHFISVADKLVKAQKLTGRWTIVLHYDLYVAWVLMHVYHETKNKRYLRAVLKFLRFGKLHKTPIGLYPIHYLPFGLIEIGSGYSTNQLARLNYYLYFETGNNTFKNFGDSLLPVIANKLKRGNGIAKLYRQKEKNNLATMWHKHNQLLKTLSPKDHYFDL